MAKIGRPRAEVVLTESERAELIRLTKRARVNRAIAFRARTVADETIEAVIVKTLETTPPGEMHWSTRSMAKAAGLSPRSASCCRALAGKGMGCL